jgi:rod shape determining protein RodA
VRRPCQRLTGERRLHSSDQVRFGPSARTEVAFSASVEKLRPMLPWLAIAGAFWLFMALYLQFKKQVWSIRDAIAPIDVVVMPAMLILAQPDLGTALVIVLVALTMMMYVGFRPLSLILLMLIGAAGSAFAWAVVLKPYQKDRVLTFLDPESDLAGAGYHQHQSMIAIGSGGLLGQGHGQGTQTQLSFLPEQQTDFIFSVWSEEQGFIGCAIVVLLFAAMILLAIRIAAQARDRFGALLAVGVTSLLFWHAVINMLMVLRLAPVVGVPLPLWSNGGSFVVTVLIGVGILLSVGMRRFVF